MTNANLDVPDGCDSALEYVVNVEAYVSDWVLSLLQTIDSGYRQARATLVTEAETAQSGNDPVALSLAVGGLMELESRKAELFRLSALAIGPVYHAIYGSEAAVLEAMRIFAEEFPQADGDREIAVEITPPPSPVSETLL